MRSPSRRIRIAILPLLVGTGLGLSGCQVGRTFFRMDSNAPVPFFGMDLLPQREKKSPTDGVSRFQSETVSRTGKAMSRQRDLSETSELRSQPATVSVKATQPAATRGWSKLLGQAPKSESFVLPVAMSAEEGGVTSDAPVEQFR